MPYRVRVPVLPVAGVDMWFSLRLRYVGICTIYSSMKPYILKNLNHFRNKLLVLLPHTQLIIYLDGSGASSSVQTSILVIRWRCKRIDHDTVVYIFMETSWYVSCCHLCSNYHTLAVCRSSWLVLLGTQNEWLLITWLWNALRRDWFTLQCISAALNTYQFIFGSVQ